MLHAYVLFIHAFSVMHHFPLPCCFYVGSNKERLFIEFLSWLMSLPWVSPDCELPNTVVPRLRVLSVALSCLLAEKASQALTPSLQQCLADDWLCADVNETTLKCSLAGLTRFVAHVANHASTNSIGLLVSASFCSLPQTSVTQSAPVVSTQTLRSWWGAERLKQIAVKLPWTCVPSLWDVLWDRGRPRNSCPTCSAFTLISIIYLKKKKSLNNHLTCISMFNSMNTFDLQGPFTLVPSLRCEIISQQVNEIFNLLKWFFLGP